MTRRTRTLGVTVVILIATTVGAAVLSPWRDTVVASGVMVLLLFGVIEAARAARSLHPAESPFDQAMRTTSTRPDRPADLDHLEAVLGWSSYSPRDFDHWARPVLRGLVRDRLAERYGIDLETDPEGARRHLSSELWAVAAPMDPSTSSHQGRVASAEVSDILDRIEAL